MMSNTFGKTSKEQLETVNPVLKTLANKALEKSNVDFGILKTGGKRTPEEQNALFKAGNSQKDGYKKLSYHQSGNAVDFVPFIDGKPTWADNNAFAEIHKAVMAAWKEMNLDSEWNLVWGGDWKTFIDKPHYELHKK